jgi:hypothetical protein
MKVSELIQKLQNLDPDLEVYCYEEGPGPISDDNPGPFDICDVSQAPIKSSRSKPSNKVQFDFEGNGKGTRAVAIIGITPDMYTILSLISAKIMPNLSFGQKSRSMQRWQT